jgi:hypothetical protein
MAFFEIKRKVKDESRLWRFTINHYVNVPLRIELRDYIVTLDSDLDSTYFIVSRRYFRKNDHMSGIKRKDVPFPDDVKEELMAQFNKAVAEITIV